MQSSASLQHSRSDGTRSLSARRPGTLLARRAAHGAGRSREPPFASARGPAERRARARPPWPASRHPHGAGPERRCPSAGPGGRDTHLAGPPLACRRCSRGVPGALPRFPGAGPSGSRRSPGSRAPPVSTATASGAAAPTTQRLIGRAALPQPANGSAPHWEAEAALRALGGA